MIRENGVRKRRAGAEDIEIGQKIRAQRLDRGLSQSGLAAGINLTFQQVQKYEKGVNRVSAGRLAQIAAVLDVPVMFFYGGSTTARRGAPANTLSFMQSKGAMRLVKAYRDIPSRTSKHALVVLAESLRKGPGA